MLALATAPGGRLGAAVRDVWGRMTGNGTLTRADLADTLNRQIGLSRAESATMVESILDMMCDALHRGENVKISSFGTFVLRDKTERVGRNPKTGVEVPIAPRRVLTFRASQSMRDRIAR
jgi:integration host factor subunit alpha